jgi:hypothetical protein
MVYNFTFWRFCRVDSWIQDVIFGTDWVEYRLISFVTRSLWFKYYHRSVQLQFPCYTTRWLFRSPRLPAVCIIQCDYTGPIIKCAAQHLGCGNSVLCRSTHLTYSKLSCTRCKILHYRSLYLSIQRTWRIARDLIKISARLQHYRSSK